MPATTAVEKQVAKIADFVGMPAAPAQVKQDYPPLDQDLLAKVATTYPTVRVFIRRYDKVASILKANQRGPLKSLPMFTGVPSADLLDFPSWCLEKVRIGGGEMLVDVMIDSHPEAGSIYKFSANVDGPLALPPQVQRFQDRANVEQSVNMTNLARQLKDSGMPEAVAWQTAGQLAQNGFIGSGLAASEEDMSEKLITYQQIQAQAQIDAQQRLAQQRAEERAAEWAREDRIRNQAREDAERRREEEEKRRHDDDLRYRREKDEREAKDRKEREEREAKERAEREERALALKAEQEERRLRWEAEQRDREATRQLELEKLKLTLLAKPDKPDVDPVVKATLDEIKRNNEDLKRRLEEKDREMAQRLLDRDREDRVSKDMASLRAELLAANQDKGTNWPALIASLSPLFLQFAASSKEDQARTMDLMRMALDKAGQRSDEMDKVFSSMMALADFGLKRDEAKMKEPMIMSQVMAQVTANQIATVQSLLQAQSASMPQDSPYLRLVEDAINTLPELAAHWIQRGKPYEPNPLVADEADRRVQQALVQQEQAPALPAVVDVPALPSRITQQARLADKAAAALFESPEVRDALLNSESEWPNVLAATARPAGSPVALGHQWAEQVFADHQGGALLPAIHDYLLDPASFHAVLVVLGWTKARADQAILAMHARLKELGAEADPQAAEAQAEVQEPAPVEPEPEPATEAPPQVEEPAAEPEAPVEPMVAPPEPAKRRRHVAKEEAVA